MVSKEKIEENRKEIERLLKFGKNKDGKKISQRDIARKFHLTEQRISQIKGEMLEQMRQEARKKKLFYIEHEDHGHGNIPLNIGLPVLACVGFLESENDEAIFLKCVWSKTTNEVFHRSIIIKRDIIRMVEYKQIKEIINKVNKIGQNL